MSDWKAYQGQSLVLSGDGVHIWRVTLADLPGLFDELSGFVASDEAIRAKRFLRKQDGCHYLMTKALQRLILARYLSIPPQEIVYQYGVHGKPVVKNYLNYQFNLSHAGGAVLLAVAKTDVGVDLEKEKSAVDFSSLVRRFFSAKEQGVFFNLSESVQKCEFYQLWVRKEAFIKATGYGLTFPLSDFTVTTNNEAANNLLLVDSLKASQDQWVVQGLGLDGWPDDFYAAIAKKGRLGRIVCWDLSVQDVKKQLFEKK